MKESEEEKTNETENKREERDKLRGWHCLQSHAASVPCRAQPSVPFPFLANSMHCPPVFARPPSPRCARSIHFSLKLFSSPSCAPAHRKSLVIFQKMLRRGFAPAESRARQNGVVRYTLTRLRASRARGGLHLVPYGIGDDCRRVCAWAWKCYMLLTCTCYCSTFLWHRQMAER